MDKTIIKENAIADFWRITAQLKADRVFNINSALHQYLATQLTCSLILCDVKSDLLIMLQQGFPEYDHNQLHTIIEAASILLRSYSILQMQSSSVLNN